MLPDALRRWLRPLGRPDWASALLLVALALPVGVSVRRTSIRTYTRLYGMGETIRVSDKTIQVSEEFYEWLKARQNDEESLEETLRRVAGGPHPSEVAGLFTPEEAEEMKEAVKRLRKRDRSRLERAREAFADDE